MTYRSALLGGYSLLLAAACGPGVVEEPLPAWLDLTAPGADALTVEKPAKVSLFFSAQTSRGEPVSALTPNDFTVEEDGVAVNGWESKRSLEAKGQRYRMDSLVLIDFSGSILRSGNFPAVREAALAYVRSVLGHPGDGQRVALYTFDGRATPQPVVGFSSDLKALEAGLASLEVRQCMVSADCASSVDARTCAGWRCVDDATNLYGAVAEAAKVLQAERDAATRLSFKDSALVVMSDGGDSAGRMARGDAVLTAARSGAHVFSVGFGDQVDEDALKALGTSGYFAASQGAALTTAFQKIADRVTGLANRYFQLTYCSPKRQGTHTLTVRASVKTLEGVLQGSVSRDFDATGFSSGCEL